MSITKENQLQSQINNLKRRINCLCSAIIALEAQVVVEDGTTGWINADDFEYSNA